MTETSRDAKRAESAQKILEAAQEEFAVKGFKAATIRSIAERAGVHASLVMQHYGSKSGLFATAVQLPADDDNAASGHLLDVLDSRMQELPPETRALVRSMLTEPEAEAFMHRFLAERVDNLKGTYQGEDAEIKATLAVSSILGLTITRHFLKLPTFDKFPRESIVSTANAWFNALSSDLDQHNREGQYEP